MEAHRLSRRLTKLTFVLSLKSMSGAALAALLSFAPWSTVQADAGALETQPLTFQTNSGKRTIEVEVADTDQKRSVGLMFRRSLGDDKGMIFLYNKEQIITMWMKNTYLSLDMIFVRKNGTIHRIEKNTEPFSERVISSGAKVLAVIEVKAGNADRFGLKQGDKVKYPAFQK